MCALLLLFVRLVKFWYVLSLVWHVCGKPMLHTLELVVCMESQSCIVAAGAVAVK
jgi:hypothetical protein